MSVTDVSTFIGDYPYRRIEPATPEWLLAQMDIMDVEYAWVGHLPSFLYRDPTPGNLYLETALEPYRDRLKPVFTIHPNQPKWEDDLNQAVETGAPAIRAYPMHSGVDPCGGEMRVLTAAAGSAGVPLMLTVRFEDSRQRHPRDTAADLPAAAIRTLIRSDREARIVISNADRAFVEEVHFGLAPGEAARLLWDFSWLWGPPMNDLMHLLVTIGHDRFALGTCMPLRIPDASFAKLDLIELNEYDRARLLGENLVRWMSH